MVNIRINKKWSFKMATKASEIPLEKGIQIMDLLSNKKIISLNEKIAVISLLTNLETSLISNIEDEDVLKLYDKIEITKDLFKVYFPKCFKIKGKEFGLVDFNNITVREWSEIEFFAEDGESPFSNLGEIMSICLRPLKSKNKSLKDILLNIIFRIKFKGVIPYSLKQYKVEDFKEEHLQNKNIFIEYCDFGTGYGLINEIFRFKLQLKDDYKLLFKTETESIEEPTEKELEFAEIWGTYHVINEISQNIFERDAWYNKPLKEFYKYIVYKKQKTLYELRNGSKQ